MTIQEKFEKYNNDNPIVYDTLVALAREAKRAGKTKLGVKLLVERARWELMFNVKTLEEFKINNSFTSRYARLIMEKEKDLNGFFDLKMLKSA